MKMINRVVLCGRLTKDPELRYTPSGVAVATFSLAVNRQFKNAQGEKEADFINIVVWRQLAELCANYLKKGNQCAVDGRIQTRSYDKDGHRVYVTEIVAENVQFLTLANTQGSGQSTNIGHSSASSDPFAKDPFADSPKIDLPDDFPFL